MSGMFFETHCRTQTTCLWWLQCHSAPLSRANSASHIHVPLLDWRGHVEAAERAGRREERGGKEVKWRKGREKIPHPNKCLAMFWYFAWNRRMCGERFTKGIVDTCKLHCVISRNWIKRASLFLLPTLLVCRRLSFLSLVFSCYSPHPSDLQI